MGNSLSVLACTNLGSSLSLRSFCRMGAALSVVGVVKLPSSVQMTADSAIYAFDTSVNTLTRRMSFPGSGSEGILHGFWTADQALTTSDRRFKRDIKPLHRTLLARMKFDGESPANEFEDGPDDAVPGATRDERASAVDWVLRELRPVSFSFKNADTKKFGDRRYGFIAQEVEKIIPELVRNRGNTKYMVYQDLISLVTLAAKDQQERLEKHQTEVSKLRTLVSKLGEKLGSLQSRVASITKRRV